MDNIMNLAKQNGFKKIMVMRDRWNYGNWCIVNSVKIKSNGYGSADGFIQYADGNRKYGNISCAGCYTWRVIKVLDEDMEVEYI